MIYRSSMGLEGNLPTPLPELSLRSEQPIVQGSFFSPFWLWHHLQAGEITSPSKQELFYLSQRPYLVVGTLRDQLLYPAPPARVWKGSKPADKQLFTSIAGEEPKYSNLDEGETAGNNNAVAKLRC